jgi:mRNA-degrading endonuclease YafQ of YafQ-DinJ toxin-antitoxin module
MAECVTLTVLTTCLSKSWEMYSINYTHQFKKDMRKCAKRGLDIEEIKTVIKILSETGTLPAEYRPHQLKAAIKRVQCQIAFEHCRA